MASKTPKKKESKERVSSSTVPKSTPEQPVSQGLGRDKDDKSRKGHKQPILIWPEWSDQDIAAEKWDTMYKGKDKEKGKSPNLHSFEDPEGRIDLPLAIQTNVDCWKRPIDFVEDKTPVVVDPESFKEKDIDILSCSAFGVTDSEVMRCIIADVTNLAKLKPKIESIEMKSVKDLKDKDKEKSDVVQNEESIWKPWQHIWPKEKSKTGVHSVCNASGKYVVKIFWMGSWRKVTIDDWMPFNSEGDLLLPSSKRPYELWPMLLSKALLKVASLDYNGGKISSEFGDFNAVQCLTGWMPEIIPLRREHSGELWQLLGKILPHWKLENSITMDEVKEVVIEKKKKEEKEKKPKEKTERGFASQSNSERSSERESRLKDKESKDRFPANGSNSVIKEIVREPEYAVFASYSNPPKTPMRVSVLREIADASEKLRQSGLSHNHPHSVMVTLRRDIPLVAPPPPIEVPRWKLIRQKKRKQPRDPRLTPIEPPKEPQFLEVTSPFVSYSVSPIPVGRVRTPNFKKYQPDKDNMAEIMEEGGEKREDMTKKMTEEGVQQEEEKIEEVVVVAESPSRNDESVKRRESIVAKIDKPDVEKAVKPQKDGTRSGKAERSNSIAQEKNNKAKKASKTEQNAEKKNEPASQSKSPGGRRMSKTDIKGVVDKDSKKAGKLEKEPKNEVKVEVIEASVADDGQQNGAAEKGEEINTSEESPETQEENLKKSKEKKMWMEYDDFWKCFGILYIYHKPVTYTFSKSYLELKNVALTTHSKKSGIGLHSSSMAGTQGGGKGQGAPSPVGHHGLGGSPIDPPPPYLFVDSLNAIEIVVNFSAFSKWLDPPQPIFREKGKEVGSNLDLKADSATDLTPAVPSPGLLVAEPYSWKSLVTGQPCLRMKTTGSKAAVLVLPPGRHVLRFLLQSPNGYHVGLSSQTPFTFGDEDLVMSCLQKESCRFIEHTTGVLQSIGNAVTSFGELSTNDKHTVLNLGVKDQPREIQDRHYQVFMACLLETLGSLLCEDYTRDVNFAWKAFDYIARVYLKERFTFRPKSSSEVARVGSIHKTQSDLSRCLSSSNQQLRTMDEEVAATKIQATFRGYYVRKLHNAYKPGTSIHQHVLEQLTKCWVHVENNLETCAIQLYRRIFKLDQDLFPLFPFFKDEWTRVTFADYNGSFLEQPENNWFLLFREVFYVDEDVLMVPKMYTNIPTCFLRVVNNDTCDEIPKVFQRVAPYTFTKNKHGYTFLAEARSCSSSIASGKFRLRLIGSTDPLPSPEGDAVNTHFVAKEIRDYYIPNKPNVLFRYSVHVTEDLLISVQLCTSKPDVFIKLQVLDNEEEVASATGRGHTVIPVHIARRDRNWAEEDSKQRKKGSRPPSKDSGKDGRPLSTAAKNQKSSKAKKPSGKESSPGHSRPGSSQGKRSDIAGGVVRSITQEEDLKPQVHKYIIQAVVLRDSWPLSRDAWDFVVALKNAERQGDSDADSSGRGEKSASQNKGKKGKDGKDSRSGKNQPGSRPASQQLQFDNSKPNWTLRIVSDANCDEDIDIKRDTERQDEIRAMKAAWETAQPGRAAKAQKCRQKYLNENLMKVNTDAECDGGDQGEEQGESADVMTSSSLTTVAAEQEEYFTEPPPRQPSRILKPFDISRYVRSRGERIILDETEENKRREQRQGMFRRHKVWRDEVEKRRERDRVNRNMAKERQIQLAEEWQATLDKAREDTNTTREAYRQTFIVTEHPEEEPPDHEDRSPSPPKDTKKGKSPKGARKSPKAKKK